MAFVRFATKCDKCGRRSEEYTAWPECRECGEHICKACDVAPERSEDERHLTLCKTCGVRLKEVTTPNISYREFCQLLLSAAGPFGYVFGGKQMLCDPSVYAAVHGLDGARRCLARRIPS